MQVLDKNGKLFGLINALDACCLFVTVVLLAALGWRKMHPPGGPGPSMHYLPVTRNVLADVILSDTSRWMIPHLAQGIARIDHDMQAIAEITQVGVIDIPGHDSATVVTWQIRISEDRSGIPMFGRYPIVPGGQFLLSTSNFVFRGTVYRVRNIPQASDLGQL